MDGVCRVLHERDAKTATTGHSSCAQQYLITVEMVEHKNAPAEPALHVDLE